MKIFLCLSLLLLVFLMTTECEELIQPKLELRFIRNAGVIFRNCTGDGDCLQGEFCRFKTQFPVCTRCTDCPGIHRRVAILDCAQTRKDCGTCLSGYKEVTHSIMEMICVKIQDLIPEAQTTLNTTAEDSPKGKKYGGTWTPGVLMVLMVTILAAFGALMDTGRRYIPVIFRKLQAEDDKTRIELTPCSSSPAGADTFQEIDEINGDEIFDGSEDARSKQTWGNSECRVQMPGSSSSSTSP